MPSLLPGRVALAGQGWRKDKDRQRTVGERSRVWVVVDIPQVWLVVNIPQVLLPGSELGTQRLLGFNCLTLQPLVEVSPELVWFDSSTSCRSESGFGFLTLQPLVCRSESRFVWFDSSTSCRSESGFGFLFLSSEILRVFSSEG